MIAAIGSDGRRPVVWGLGETAEEALADAAEQGNRVLNGDGDGPWDSGGSATCEIAEVLAGRIEWDGEVSCESLGILVRCDRDGRIVDAAVRS